MASVYKRGSRWYVKWKGGDGVWRWRSLETGSKRKADDELRGLKRALRGDGEHWLLGEGREGEGGPRLRGDDAECGMGEALTLEGLREAYREWGGVNRRRGTVAHRVAVLGALESWLGSGEVRWDSVTGEVVEGWKSHLLTRSEPKRAVGGKTVNGYLAALQAVVARAIGEGWYSGPNVFVEVARVPEGKRLPRWLTQGQIEKVLGAAEVYSRTMHLVFSMGIDAGLRKGEMDAARGEWFSNGVVHVQEGPGFKPKDAEERAFPLRRRLASVLELHGVTEGEYVIEPGKGWGKNRYRFEMKKAFQEVASDAGVGWCTPHVLRHTFGAQLAQAGVSLYKIGVWMGHSNPRTTRIYAHLCPGDEDIEKF